MEIPIWVWGGLSGLALGLIGLIILYPGCKKGTKSILIRFVVSFLLKLFLAGAGFWLAIKYYNIESKPLALGFMAGYFFSLFIEIIPCIWKLRQCTENAYTPG